MHLFPRGDATRRDIGRHTLLLAQHCNAVRKCHPTKGAAKQTAIAAQGARNDTHVATEKSDRLDVLKSARVAKKKRLTTPRMHKERDKDNIGCRSKWECCQTDVTAAATGCKISCCKSPPGSTGCKEQYSCCKQSYPSMQGCKDEWTCCSTIDPSPGCLFQWTCCQAVVPLNNPNDPDKACQKICKVCQKAWGDSQGCSAEVSHDFGDK
ncbi:hypothetical protein RFI_24323 [Reticulomyxa filosa]|uniref:Uncharacterized protein n=1 Tax=Reticulomyxa filosa TaxID=46433 RepID=X6MHZ6_RETFI|nr:hypothetical protein RFI_24323 [Reticulomyxa filosa]|eukprot:ETO13052.1 hypothetical protein RFI_24323 [Reticulomyxa filosa]